VFWIWNTFSVLANYCDWGRCLNEARNCGLWYKILTIVKDAEDSRAVMMILAASQLLAAYPVVLWNILQEMSFWNESGWAPATLLFIFNPPIWISWQFYAPKKYFSRWVGPKFTGLGFLRALINRYLGFKCWKPDLYLKLFKNCPERKYKTFFD
jgi:hypothetical protein